jgi:uncharacterized protein
MQRKLGTITQLTHYPVKSMAGINQQTATLGWHGLPRDRRFAFRRMADNSGFPWLSASRLPELIRYQPLEQAEGPPAIRTPSGIELGLWSEALRTELSQAFGSDVQLMHLKQGVFDEAPISLISQATIGAIAQAAGIPADVRRFRPNIVIETHDPVPFNEDSWLDAQISFGDSAAAARIALTQRDPRCVMINLDPETAKANPQVMRAAVRLNQNNAGVYATVTQVGELHVGQVVYLHTL